MSWTAPGSTTESGEICTGHAKQASIGYRCDGRSAPTELPHIRIPNVTSRTLPGIR